MREDERTTREELLRTVNEALRTLPDDPSPEQIDVLLLAAGFNPKAVRSFARALSKQGSLVAPPEGVDAAVLWARDHLCHAVDDLFAAGGRMQAVMMAAQSLPSYVAAKAKSDGERVSTGGGNARRQDKSKP